VATPVYLVVPNSSGRAVVLSMARMNSIGAIDPLGQSLVVEAGATLASVQQAATDASLYFPLSMGSEESCTIGGTLATNAGGIAVLRYGTMRALALGLEVVLPDGRVWDGMLGLRKDNTGYDLKDLFIGSEGTLGVITRAVLKLYPQPKARATVFVALNGLEQALELLQLMREHHDDQLCAFEFMEKPCLDLIAAKMPHVRLPFDPVPKGAVLIELSDAKDHEVLQNALETTLGIALEGGMVSDALLAQHDTQRSDFWRVRESISAALAAAGKAARHDIALPIQNLVKFIAEAGQFVNDITPDAQPIVFGHLGDGNLHYNVIGPQDNDQTGFMERREPLVNGVHDLVKKYRGSISAEHGIGQLRRSELARIKPSLDLALMRQIKDVFDPDGLMNPGKLL
jgi:FAD/FMN-containing dehydrogenase